MELAHKEIHQNLKKLEVGYNNSKKTNISEEIKNKSLKSNRLNRI